MITDDNEVGLGMVADGTPCGTGKVCTGLLLRGKGVWLSLLRSINLFCKIEQNLLELPCILTNG